MTSQPKPLVIQNVSKRFGGLLALRDVSITLEPGERRVVIGPNGAGKTTLINLIGGAFAPTSGKVYLLGHDVTVKPPHRRSALGLARTFQITNLFPNMTILDHILLVLQSRELTKFVVFRPLTSYDRLHDAARRILESWGMWEKRETYVRNLSYGDQRQLEIVLALAANPRVVLLDEPTAGLSQGESRSVVDIIHHLDRSVAMLLVEHDVDMAFAWADRVTVLHEGAVLMEGIPQQARADARVMDIYLGTQTDAVPDVSPLSPAGQLAGLEESDA